MATTLANSTGPDAELQTFVHNTVVPIILGLVIQQILLGLIVFQTCRYFAHFGDSKDPKFYLCIIGTFLLLNISECGLNIYLLLEMMDEVRGGQYLSLKIWKLWNPVFTVVIIFFSQVFFLQRCWALSKGFVKTWAVLVGSVPLLLSSLGFGLAFSISSLQPEPFSWVPTCFTCWFIVALAADVSTASIQIVILKRRSIGQPRAIKQNNMSASVQLINGRFLMAFVVWLVVVLFIEFPETGYYLVLQFSISRVYTIAVLSTVTGRNFSNRAKRRTPNVATPQTPQENAAIFEAAVWGFLGIEPPRTTPAGPMRERTTETVTVNITSLGESDMSPGSPQPEPEMHKSETQSAV
ncbi:hypothetical protein B0H11DRAFT_2185599 [Mycena galericulata]|nr:hypothetical protein B0H11DRAFT_2185599 [Mycena galericulata]